MKKLTLLFGILALSIGQTFAQEYKTIGVSCYKNSVGVLQKMVSEFKAGSVKITADNVTFSMYGATASHNIRKVETLGRKTRIFTNEGHRVTISPVNKTITVDKTKTDDGLYDYTYIYQIK